MKLINPLGIPWDEYVAMHVREIVAALLLAVILLCALPFVEFPGGTTLTGRVTSQGKPVVFGTVTVVTSDQRRFSVPISPDGTYVLKGVPPGSVKLAISSPNPHPVAERQAVEPEASGNGNRGESPRSKPRPAGGSRPSGQPSGGAGQGTTVEGVSIAATSERGPAAPDAGRSGAGHTGWFRIPGRYASPVTSGIGTEVRRGRTTLDVSLD
jgi:hypothetical protein